MYDVVCVTLAADDGVKRFYSLLLSFLVSFSFRKRATKTNWQRDPSVGQQVAEEFLFRSGQLFGELDIEGYEEVALSRRVLRMWQSVALHSLHCVRLDDLLHRADPQLVPVQRRHFKYYSAESLRKRKWKILVLWFGSLLMVYSVINPLQQQSTIAQKS